MLRQAPASAPVQGIDRRIWPMMVIISFFAVIVVKEISLPMAVLAGVGGLGLFGLFMTALQTPAIALYMLVAYVPFSRVLTGDFGTQAYAFNMTNILILLVLAGYLFNSSTRRDVRLKSNSPMNGLVWLFCLLGAVSLLKVGYEVGSWYVWEFITPLKRWLTPVLLYFLTLWVVRDKKTLKTIVAIIMVVTTVVALMAIRDYMYVDDASFDKSRVGGIAEHSNTLGAFFVYYMFLFLGFLLTFSRRVKAWLLLIPFGLCFRGIMVTFSRGAYLGFAMGALAACFFRNKLLFLAVVIFGVMALANPVLLPRGVSYRMGMTLKESPSTLMGEEDITENLETSAAQRIEIWRGALQMIQDHPWWGVGYGAFVQFIPYYTQGVIGHMDAHNSYLLIAAEMGIPTLIVFLLVLAAAFHYTYWLYRHTRDPSIQAIALGFLAGLFGLLAANMFGSRMDDQAVSSYFWILCGLVIRAVIMERQSVWEGVATHPSAAPALGVPLPQAMGWLPVAEYDRLRRTIAR